MSIRWMSVVAWTVAMLALWAVLTPGVLSSTGLAWASLTGLALLAIVLLTTVRSYRTVAQVPGDTDAKPLLVVAPEASGDSGERLRGPGTRGGAAQ